MYRDTTHIVAHELLLQLSRFSNKDMSYIVSEYLRNGDVTSYDLTIVDLSLLYAMSVRYTMSRVRQPLDYFEVRINFPWIETIAWRDLDIP